MISALFVEKNGIYFGMEGIDPWDEDRDAMKYKGKDSVIVHPPCSRWCQLAYIIEKRWGHKVGDDGGMFEFALNVVRQNGGVLEHPAYSIAWKWFNLLRPNRHGGWTGPDEYGGYTCHVEQGMYGHPARKKTWLYAVGCSLPEMKWGDSSEHCTAIVSNCANHNSIGMEGKRRVSQKEAARTPEEFQSALIDMAGSVL